MKSVLRCAVLAFVLGLTPLCNAAVLESEAGGSSLNNLRTTAQRVGVAEFSPNASPLAFGTLPTALVTGRGGSEDVDFFAFDALPGLAWFDIDSAGFDAILSLFDASGTLIAYADDMLVGEVDPGSADRFDPFLGSLKLPRAGTYFIAVSAFNVLGSNLPLGAFSGTQKELVRPDGLYGGDAVDGALSGESGFLANAEQAPGAPEYQLRISLERPSVPAAAPAPATLGLIFCGAAVLALCRRR